MSGKRKPQAVDMPGVIPRLKVRTLIPSEVRRSIYSMLTIHMRGVRRTARAHGLHEAEVEEILFDEMARRQNEAVKEAFRAGQRSTLPRFPRQIKRAA